MAFWGKLVKKRRGNGGEKLCKCNKIFTSASLVVFEFELASKCEIHDEYVCVCEREQMATKHTYIAQMDDNLNLNKLRAIR